MQKLPMKPKRYQITATLLNSWQYIFDCVDWYHADSDDESLETKQQKAQEESIKSFYDTLTRKPIDSEAMAKGRQYESDVYAGKDSVFSPIVAGGAFQATFTKKVEVDGLPIMLYGVLDVLKAGRIMDIKRVGYYSSGKYENSHQHPMYLTLVPEATDFVYLICDDKGNHVFEKYTRKESEDILVVCSQFLSWLKAHDMFETYKQYWDNEILTAKAERRNANGVGK